MRRACSPLGPMALLSLAHLSKSAALSSSNSASVTSGSTSSATLTLPSTTPSSARKIDPQFAGFAFEEASFVEYAIDTDGKPNTYSQNMINAVSSRTDVAPVIRVGGTSGDYAVYDPQASAPADPQAKQDGFQTTRGLKIGPSYFEGFKNFPGAKYILGVPFASNNLSNTIAFAKAGVQAIGADNLQAIEIGNEPNAYSGDGGTMPHPTNESYVAAFQKYEAALLSNLTLPTGPLFQTLDTGSGNIAQYPVPTVFHAGINSNDRIDTVAEHYYQTTYADGISLQSTLMSHAAITAKLATYQAYAAFCASLSPPIPFILSEAGNAIDKLGAPYHHYDFEAVLGSALWAVDWSLHAMAIGVTRVNLQQILHAGFNLWFPVDSQEPPFPAQTFASFYAMPFVADFIGTSHASSVVPLGTLADNVAAYAAFENGGPVRLAIVNLRYWAGDGARPAVQVALQAPPGTNSVKVDRLGAPGGATADASSMSYAGLQWTAKSGGMAVKFRDDSTEPEVGDGGKVSVVVEDSEAVLVTFC